MPFTHDRFALWAPIALSVGMTALFLDLEHKLYVFRFYTSFEPTSPMSWGAWILILVYPLMMLQTFSVLRRGYPALAGWVERLPFGGAALDVSEHLRRPVAALVIPLAVGLGIYTGVLLSAFSARPFWNTGLLGPLFLVSGLSTAAALALIGARLDCEKHFFTRADITLIGIELTFIAMLVINLSTGAAQQLETVNMVLGGAYTVPFWLWFVLPGLLIPIVLEIFEMRGICRFSFLASLLVLYGGFMLRYLTVEMGQVSTWTDYAVQFDPQLLLRLTQ
jgi:formate-dependent nitrite reductase membrane component NrfD